MKINLNDLEKFEEEETFQHRKYNRSRQEDEATSYKEKVRKEKPNRKGSKFDSVLYGEFDEE